jgi:transcriptional regulator with XRE-family HTH domain
MPLLEFLMREVCMQESVASVLSQLREALNITQEDIIRRCDISLRTVRNAERGDQPLKRRSALQILGAVNSFLKDQEKPELTLDDLKLKIS